jgi:hypothetical protein
MPVHTSSPPVDSRVEAHMCKQINFAIAAAAVGLAITFWAKSQWWS